MTQNQALADALTAIDNATTRLGTSTANVSTNVDGVSTRVDALVKSLADSATPEQIAEFKTAMDAETTRLDAAAVALDTISTTLNGIAADPATPVPPLPAEVVAEPIGG